MNIESAIIICTAFILGVILSWLFIHSSNKSLEARNQSLFRMCENLQLQLMSKSVSEYAAAKEAIAEVTEPAPPPPDDLQLQLNQIQAAASDEFPESDVGRIVGEDKEDII